MCCSQPHLKIFICNCFYEFFYRGIEAIVIDYVRPILFGPLIPKISLILCYILSAATLGGLLYFNYNDVGITKGIQQFWAAQKAPPKSEPAAK